MESVKELQKYMIPELAIIVFDYEKDPIPFLINNSYGSFSISDEVYEKYKKLNGDTKSVPKLCISRTDPLIIQLYDEYYHNNNMENFNDEYSSVYKEMIPYKAYITNTYKFREYNGEESIFYDVKKTNAKFNVMLIMDKLDVILHDNTTDDCKLSKQDLRIIQTALKQL